MIKKFQSLKRIDQILVVGLILFTFIRVMLQVKLPLFLQGGAGFDDFLLMDYAKNLVKGDWLGPFGSKTLAKGISFPIFVGITYLLSIPYSLGLILLYIAGIILFLFAIKPYISNKWYLSILYVFLLFSPVMFHVENVQKIYRGGLIVCMSLIVLATMISIFNCCRDKKFKNLVCYSTLGAIALPFFYYIKEDSIWIMPFVFTSLAVSIGFVLFSKKINRKFLRSFLIVLPILSLCFTNIIYSSINYWKYGEYTITDRSGTYFKEMMADIIRIDEENEVKNVWITKNMMYQAIDHSKTLQTIKPYIDDMYEHSWAVQQNGEIEADIIYWTFKEAVADAGIYEQGGKAVNHFYQKVDQELDQAVESGSLKLSKKKKLYISPITIGYTMDQLLEYYPKTMSDAIHMMVTYRENDTDIYNATGPMYAIIMMDHFTNSETVWPEELSPVTEPYHITISFITSIVSIYQSTGYAIFILGIIGFLLFTIRMVIDIRSKKIESFYLWMILLGLLGTCFVLLFGVLWFCSCFGGSIMRHIYNYSCGIIPVIQILEFTGIYFLFHYGKEFVLKRNNKE
ncbi:MAG: hypothetical protein IJ193_06730 [Bacilli bacterium]|nr:hypothetical protein [Bacilli bacterium]